MSSLKRKAGGAALGSDAKKTKQDGSITSFFGAPKAMPAAANGASKTAAGVPARAAPEPAGPTFDKAKWAAALTDEQRQLLQVEIDTLHESWLALLKDELISREFLDLKKFLAKEDAAGKEIFPPKQDIYSWSRHTPFNTVKVVILGQDPYHNRNQAHGLAFSVRPPTRAPPSLNNMYKALKKDYPAFKPPPKDGGLLTPWADRGVLLLNTCLTVRAHEANSHANQGWERFTQRVIDLVAARRTRGVAFLAWGAPAGKRVAKVDGKRHLVLKSAHPSPLSAMRGFFDCGHFRKANEWLVQRYGSDGEIDWGLGEGSSTLSTANAESTEPDVRPKAGVAKKEPSPAEIEDDDDLDAELAVAAAEAEAKAEGEAAGAKNGITPVEEKA